MPFWHFSPVVQRLPSLQLFPFFEGSASQVPVSGSHFKHCEQVTLTDPWVHLPFWQVSDVQRLPVSHGVPLVTLVRTQPVAGSQVSIVHGLSSSQSTSSPMQTPLWQVSLVVHGFSSSHALPF
jgi:hypothetical protein